MAVSKRLRYEVFRRDSNTCRYCGAKAPDVEITIDHVVPVALGGSDEPSNLVTACRDCNGGKTSSSPDGPLVDGVAADALKWAAAIKQAQAAMVTDLSIRQAHRDSFQTWWDAWGYDTDDGRKQIPKDAGWQVTVDQFVAAGLPMPILKGCIELAMTRRKVQDENKFKYMCGIAWSKVTEIQKAARRIADGDAPAEGGASPAADSLMQGRADLARELLGEVSDEESAYFLECSDVNEFLNEDEQRTKGEEACEAVSSMLNSARCNLDWLVDQIRKTFAALPAEIGQSCLNEMKAASGIGDPLSRMAHEAQSGLFALEDLIDLSEALSWSNELAEHERTEWLDFSRAININSGLTHERLIVRAWRYSKVIADGNHYTVMCCGPGANIPDCPARGTYYAKLTGFDCCESDDDDHQGHLFCERHLEQLMDGGMTSQRGRDLQLVDFTPVPAEPDPWAPF